MATTVSKTRTNYFAVKDTDAFRKLMENLETNDGKAFLIDNSRGEVGFAADGRVFGINPNLKYANLDVMETEMIHLIQALIEPGHACIITEISWENLKDLNGTALIITQQDVKSVILTNAAVETAKTMLADPDYEPDMVY